MADFGNIRSGLGSVDASKVFAQEAKETQQELSAEQNTSLLGFQAAQKEATNPLAARMRGKEKTSKTHGQRVNKMLESGEKSGRLPVEAIKKSAEEFQQRNPELKAKTLFLLREQIKPDDSPEDILKKVLEFYSDVSLADEALEFLMETTDGALREKVKQAKEEFNEMHGREITAGRNIGAEAREAAEKGLGTPTSMRDMYRDITGNPRDATTMFSELTAKYAYKEMFKVVKFLLHSLGAELKSKGPSIPRGLLHNILQETRSLQAILGVYRFFKSRMGLIDTLFAKEGIEVPKELTFETLAKQFMSLVAERYPTSDKVLQSTKRLGIDKWIIAKIIALSQLRDAIREVALRQIYRSVQHRDELFSAIIEALEDLEDELEELMDQLGMEDDEEEEGEK